MTAAVFAFPAQARPEDRNEGYSEFYARYHRPLRCYLRVAFPTADVDGVAQDTFCQVLHHWPKIRAMSNPWPWLAVTARNLARNNIRDEQACRPAGLDVFDRGARSADDVPEQVHATDQLRRLAKAMEVLTPLQRVLLTVLVEEGLTGTDLARRLGLQPGATRMHLSRMRARLAARFADVGGQLAVVPLALLQLVLRRPRRGDLGARQAPVLAGSASIAFSLAVVAVGGAMFGVSPGTPALSSRVPVAPQALSVPADEMALVSPVSQRRTSAPAQRAGAQPQQESAVTYYVALSKTPTRPGKTAEAGLSIPTPVGTVRVYVPVIMQSPEPGSKCPLIVTC